MSKQIIRNIASIIYNKPEKLTQLDKVAEICIACTSDTGIDITAEIYAGNIVRYLITGTRCKMTITADAITKEITRKHRNEKPIEVYSFHANTEDITEVVKEIEAAEEAAATPEATEAAASQETKKQMYRTEWLDACFSKQQPAESITAYFTNGTEANYTSNIYNLLVTDPGVKMITSNETGEILFER